jgi:hypothetical protein
MAARSDVHRAPYRNRAGSNPGLIFLIVVVNVDHRSTDRLWYLTISDLGERGLPMASSGRSSNRSSRIIVPSPRWIWAVVGVMGLCMVGYIIAATG